MLEVVEGFLTTMQHERGASRNTVAAYRNDLGQFTAYLSGALPEAAAFSPVNSPNRINGGSARIGDWALLGEGGVSDYLAYLRTRGYATATIAWKTAAVKSFSSYLKERGYLTEDPAAMAARPRVEKVPPRAMTEEEIRSLMTALRSNVERPQGLRDIAMLETLYATGMRVSELVALDERDVSLRDSALCCARGCSKERLLQLPELVTAAIASYLEGGRALLAARSESALFVNHRGHRLTRQGFWLILRNYAEQAAIPGVTPHTLRHSFAAHALIRGVELKDVQQSLGHVNLATTQTYQRIEMHSQAKPNLARNETGPNATAGERNNTAR